MPNFLQKWLQYWSLTDQPWPKCWGPARFSCTSSRERSCTARINSLTQSLTRLRGARVRLVVYWRSVALAFVCFHPSSQQHFFSQIRSKHLSEDAETDRPLWSCRTPFIIIQSWESAWDLCVETSPGRAAHGWLSSPSLAAYRFQSRWCSNTDYHSQSYLDSRGRTSGPLCSDLL